MSLHFPFSSLLPIFFVIIFILKWMINRNRKNNQAPSPPKLPIIGNLHQIGSLPHRSFYSLSRKYGDTMLLHFGSKLTLVVSSAKSAREILKTHDLTFSNRPNSIIKNKLTYGLRDIAFATLTEDWRQKRSILVLQLLNNKRVASLRSVGEEEIMTTLEKIKTSCSSSDQAVNLSKMFISLTNDIVARVALGSKYRSDEVQGMECQRLLDNFSELVSVIDVGDYIPWLGWVSNLSGLYKKADRVAKEFDNFLESVVEEHFRREQNIDDDTEDFVDVLLEYQRENISGFSFSREDIKSIILDQGCICWSKANWRLGLKVLTFKKLWDTILNPPIPLFIPRETTKDVQIMGYDIKARTLTLVSGYAINRDPSVWEEAEVFRPERFLGNPVDYKGHDFHFIPFGAGRRGCPGIQFSMNINELAVANLVHSFDFELPNGVGIEDLDMGETVGVTVHKKVPLCVVASLARKE